MNKYIACFLMTASAVVVSHAVTSRMTSKSYSVRYGRAMAAVSGKLDATMPGLMGPGGYNPPPPKKKYPVADKSKPPAIESIPAERHRCDADKHCDWSSYMIIIGARSLYMCGHHFQKHVTAFLERGYEVRKLNNGKSK